MGGDYKALLSGCDCGVNCSDINKVRYVTFVKRYKSNQKNFWGYVHYTTADDSKSARQTEQKMFCSAAITAIKANLTFKFTLPPMVPSLR